MPQAQVSQLNPKHLEDRINRIRTRSRAPISDMLATGAKAVENGLTTLSAGLEYSAVVMTAIAHQKGNEVIVESQIEMNELQMRANASALALAQQAEAIRQATRPVQPEPQHEVGDLS